MPFDPEAIVGIGAGGLFALGIAILKYGPVPTNKNDLGFKRPRSYCEQHHHLSVTVDEIKADVKAIHDKINQVALSVEHIKGVMEK